MQNRSLSYGGARRVLCLTLALLLAVAGIVAGGTNVAFAASEDKPTIGEFANDRYNSTKTNFTVTKSSSNQTIISYDKKPGWNSVVAPVAGYTPEFTRLVITVQFSGTKQFGVDLTIPGKSNQTIRYADIALTKQSTLNADGSYTFDIPLLEYTNITKNGISSIMLYFDPTTTVSSTRSATLIDVSFKRADEPARAQPSPPIPPTVPIPPTPPIASQNPLAAIDSYICYYGNSSKAGVLDKLKAVDLAIIDVRSFGGKSEVAKLKAADTIVVGYITIGEDDGAYKASNGWYLSTKKTSWGSYIVDPGNAQWQAKIIADAGWLLDQGANGFFLDTLDTSESYPSSKPGMISLVNKLRATYPDAVIIANRGFTIAPDIAPVIDGLMFESFSSDYDPSRGVRSFGTNDLKYTDSIAVTLKALATQHDFAIITLDYVTKSSDRNRAQYIQRSLSYGFIPYVAPGQLDSIF